MLLGVCVTIKLSIHPVFQQSVATHAHPVFLIAFFYLLPPFFVLPSGSLASILSHHSLCYCCLLFDFSGCLKVDSLIVSCSRLSRPLALHINLPPPPPHTHTRWETGGCKVKTSALIPLAGATFKQSVGELRVASFWRRLAH